MEVMAEKERLADSGALPVPREVLERGGGGAANWRILGRLLSILFPPPSHHCTPPPPPDPRRRCWCSFLL